MVRVTDLERDYGVVVSGLRPHEGGFESDCWVADDTWFVKMWKQPGLPTGLGMLHELRGLGLPVPEAIPAVSGELYAVCAGRPYAVFPYVHGRVGTFDDWQTTAQALRQLHELEVRVELPPFSMDERHVRKLAQRLDHPWIVDRRDEVAAAVRRLDAAVERAQAKTVPEIICHLDFGVHNLILDDDGQIAAILDWEQAVIGPREHDLWIAGDLSELEAFLDEYGAYDLDIDHLEYALLARGLRDMAARVLNDIDRPGVDTWGFDRITRLDSDLKRFRPYCRTA
ncbi:phosphotransferase enzyme family protein [Kribbella capetownensis]|nr:aminoglycoside phosphotransferase family protein [Kribbella capetownensis]